MSKMNKKLVLVSAIVAPFVLAGLTVAHASNTVNINSHTKKVQSRSNDFATQLIPANVLNQAMKAYHWSVAQGKVGNTKTLTIVDFAMPSNLKRLWVINPNTGKVLMNLHVAQGNHTGLRYAKHFSNKNGSHESSLGAYVTANVYDGHHGESMRLSGLEKGINNNAMRRAIVVHPANYVTPGTLKAENRVGRSWGCFAVNPNKSKELIKLTRGGSVLFAYAKQENNDPNFS